MSKNQANLIAIDTKTILKTIGIIAGLYLLVNIWDIVLIMLTALIFSLALDPLIDTLAKHRLPRGLILIGIYLLLFVALVFLMSYTIPVLTSEITELANNLPIITHRAEPFFFKLNTLSKTYPWMSPTGLVSTISQSLQHNINSLLDSISNFFSGLLTLLLIAIITYYMVSEEKAMKKLIIKLLPERMHDRALAVSDRVQLKIGRWLLGQLFLCFVVFLFTYVALSVLNVKYALFLSIIAGLAEAVPFLGPIVATIPGVFIAFTQSPLLALFVAIIYFIIQQVENSILVPTIMRQAVGLDPIVSILVLLVGYELGGILGAILSIPITAIVGVLLEFKNHKSVPKNRTRLLRT
jgi:predicted PurR-regulated permease PerM